MKMNHFPIKTATSNTTRYVGFYGISSTLTIWGKITLQAVDHVNIISNQNGAKQSYENTDYQWIIWIFFLHF